MLLFYTTQELYTKLGIVSVYRFVFMDVIHHKVKEDHRYVTKEAHVVLSISMDDRKRISWASEVGSIRAANSG